LLPGCLVFWLVVSALVGFVIVLRENSKGVGSMEAAVKLRPIVEAMPEPKEPFRDYSTGSVGMRFRNDEGVVGVAKDRHAFFCDFDGGGTVVLKDSRGRVRCFFGHVCGNCNLSVASSPSQSLDEFDAQFTTNFTEQKWP